MVTGCRPFQGDTAASTLAAVIRDEPKSASALADDVPPQLTEVIERCLRKSPSERFQLMSEVGAAIQVLQEGLSVARRLHATAQKTDAKGPTAEMKTGLWRWRRIFVVAGCAAALMRASSCVNS
jgi:serine/threonine protein kinase